MGGPHRGSLYVLYNLYTLYVLYNLYKGGGIGLVRREAVAPSTFLLDQLPIAFHEAQ